MREPETEIDTNIPSFTVLNPNLQSFWHAPKMTIILIVAKPNANCYIQNVRIDICFVQVLHRLSVPVTHNQIVQENSAADLILKTVDSDSPFLKISWHVKIIFWCKIILKLLLLI